MDPRQERQLLQWCDELEKEEEERNKTLETIDDSDESEIEEVEVQGYNTDSELSAASGDEENTPVAIVHQRPTYLGKDNQTIWNVHSNKQKLKTAVRNIVTRSRGVRPHAKNAEVPFECWRLFFSDEIVAKIVTYTNKYIAKIRQNISRPRDAIDTTFDEIKALFGLLYTAGTWKGAHINIDDLWDADGPVVFRNTMGKNRFRLLLRALRFDDIADREERKKIDKLAPIREVFEYFVQKCIANYEIGYYATIDEMLDAFLANFC